MFVLWLLRSIRLYALINWLYFKFIKYYKTYPMFIQVYGNYISSSNANKLENNNTTKNWFEKEREAKLNSPELVREVWILRFLISENIIDYMFLYLQEYEKVQAELEKLKKKFVSLTINS